MVFLRVSTKCIWFWGLLGVVLTKFVVAFGGGVLHEVHSIVRVHWSMVIVMMVDQDQSSIFVH